MGDGSEPEVEWQHWARYPGWRTREAAALLLGLEPERVDPQSVPYKRLRSLLVRAHSMNKLKSPINPRNFLEWAISNGYSIPPQLSDAVAKAEPLRDWKKLALKNQKLLEKHWAQLTPRIFLQSP